MAQQISDRRDVDFVLHEQLNITDLTQNEKFDAYDKETIDLILDEARSLSIKELLPANKKGDKEGASFENGKVKVPECYHNLFELLKNGEWIALTEPHEYGGLEMPDLLAAPILEMFGGANTSFMIYPSLCRGAGELIEAFGDEKQKKLYLKKMYTGEWGGTMQLTEPSAGSDVGALTTKAKKNDDGTYSISGNKIFITGGDQDLTENIIHPVLARIEGAPKGTTGISLFLVPKIWVNDDGSLAGHNDVQITGIEHKMGLHGSATCSVTLGENGKCRGTLLGEENKGLKCMFKLMNSARLASGLQGAAIASAAYLFSLNYARERVQGKHLLSMLDPNAPSVEIINHPDVKRMLMWMKAHVDGMRSFVYFISKYFDMAEITTDEKQLEKYDCIIDILTPVVKAYCTNRCTEIASMAIQVHGGYGYTKEFPVEQLLRDCKISQIFEGTNGLQAIDLLGRKLQMKKGINFQYLISEMKATISDAQNILVLKDYANQLEITVDRLNEVTLNLSSKLMSDQILSAFAYAHPLLEVIGDVVMGWMHLWRSCIAAPKLEKLAGSLESSVRRDKAANNKEIAFYEGILTTTEYFITTILPVTHGHMESISVLNSAIVEMPDLAYGG